MEVDQISPEDAVTLLGRLVLLDLANAYAEKYGEGYDISGPYWNRVLRLRGGRKKIHVTLLQELIQDPAIIDASRNNWRTSILKDKGTTHRLIVQQWEDRLHVHEFTVRSLRKLALDHGRRVNEEECSLEYVPRGFLLSHANRCFSLQSDNYLAYHEAMQQLHDSFDQEDDD